MSQEEAVKPQNIRLVWMDMEMTGLSPLTERIIEIATIITDKDLNVIEEGPDLVVHQSDAVLNKMDDWNKKHHKKSGLWDSVRESKITLKKAEALTFEFIRKHCAHKKSPLCGNSVHHDRKFLDRYMPRISEYLHYRIVDVSSVKALASYWYPKDKQNKFKKESNHRALDDIRLSIEELRFYRKRFFRAKLVSAKPKQPA